MANKKNYCSYLLHLVITECISSNAAATFYLEYLPFLPYTGVVQKVEGTRSAKRTLPCAFQILQYVT